MCHFNSPGSMYIPSNCYKKKKYLNFLFIFWSRHRLFGVKNTVGNVQSFRCLKPTCRKDQNQPFFLTEDLWGYNQKIFPGEKDKVNTDCENSYHVWHTDNILPVRYFTASHANTRHGAMLVQRRPIWTSIGAMSCAYWLDQMRIHPLNQHWFNVLCLLGSGPTPAQS